MTALVTASDLTIQYPEAPSPVVQNAAFSVETGEVFALVGPSGCGKSTILRALAGFIPYQGRLTMAGDAIAGSNWQRGVVFQNASLYPWLTVADNIGFGLKVRGFSRDAIQKRVTDLLETVGLSGQGEKKTFELSGGMRQRVAIARVLANEPPLMLMDEPFGALDAFTRARMQQLVLDIWKRRDTTVFLITHDLNEAIRCATHIAVMTASSHQITQIVPNPYQGCDPETVADPTLEQQIDTFRRDLLKAIDPTRD